MVTAVGSCAGWLREHVTTRREPVVRTGEAPSLGRKPDRPPPRRHRPQTADSASPCTRNFRELPDDEVLDYSGAARWGHSPKPIGGIFLFVRPEIDATTSDLVVTQDFASDIVGRGSAHGSRPTA